MSAKDVEAAVEAIKAFNDALEALETAHAKLDDEPDNDAAFYAWCVAVERIKALHQPVVDRALARAKRRTT